MEYLGTEATAFSDRTEFVSLVRVSRDGQPVADLDAQRTFYPAFNMASTRAAIRSTPVEDFYVVPSENLSEGAVGFRILVNPMIWWMWVAGPVLVLGTVVALWPQGVRQTAGVKRPLPVPAAVGVTPPGPSPTAA